MQVYAKLRQRWQTLYQGWLSKRSPPQVHTLLNRNNVYIFFAKAGFGFLLLLFLMLLAAINYQNNMTYALTFLLANMLLVVVLQTYANVAGLEVSCVSVKPAFAGQHAQFKLRLQRTKSTPSVGLIVAWADAEPAYVSIEANSECELEQYVTVPRRGWYRPQRLLIESVFPLGLLRSWSWINVDTVCLVYPAPLQGPAPSSLMEAGSLGDSQNKLGNDDFSNLREYQAGDSMRSIYWKSLAKGQGLQSKQYGAAQTSELWLDSRAYQDVPVEQMLSIMCYWALRWSEQQKLYGLQLGSAYIAPQSGPKHRDAVLRELALYGQTTR